MAWWVAEDRTGQNLAIYEDATRAQAEADAIKQVGEGARLFGPFTQAQANAFNPPPIKKPGGGGSSGGGSTGTGGTGTTDIPVPNPIPGGPPIDIPDPFGGVGGAIGAASGVTEAGHFLGVLVSNLTDVHLWISMGWLWLGLTLIILGLLVWFRMSDAYKSAESAALKVIP